jgi:hypothetical protein
MRRKQLQQGKGPLELIEEAVHLLRLAPASTLLTYYLGSLPFILGLLYFWADMSRSSFAERRLPLAALAMAVLFLWMKVWQAVFAGRMRARLCGETPPRPGWRELGRMALRQTIVQPSGLIVLPLALVVLLPFGWAYAFYQNATVLETGGSGDLRSFVGKATRQALLWPAQNNYALLTLKLFGLFVFLNLVSGCLLLPFLLKTLLGVETAFSRSWWVALNTTFFAAMAGLAYLCMDPLAKTFYVLRCFYGESLQTGQDLRTELRSLGSRREISAVAVIFLWLGCPLVAQPESVFEKAAGAGYCGLGVPPLGGLARISQTPTAPRPGSAGFQPAVSRVSNLPNAGLGTTVCRLEVGDTAGWKPALRGFGPSSGREGYERSGLMPDQRIEAAGGGGAVPQRAARAPAAPSSEAGGLNSVSPPALDRAIKDVISQREYNWRLPREKGGEETEKGMLVAFLENVTEALRNGVQWVGRWLEKAMRWIFGDRMWAPRSSSFGTGWLTGLHWLLVILLVALASLLAVMLLRLWRRHRARQAEVEAQPAQALPDVADENVGADQLPEDGWIKMGRELLERGDLRLALRAFYLASLAHLAAHNLVSLAKFKTNRDYERELERRRHALPEVTKSFSENVSVFDRVWYGLHEATREMLDQFAANLAKIKAHAE